MTFHSLEFHSVEFKKEKSRIIRIFVRTRETSRIIIYTLIKINFDRIRFFFLLNCYVFSLITNNNLYYFLLLIYIFNVSTN